MIASSFLPKVQSFPAVGGKGATTFPLVGGVATTIHAPTVTGQSQQYFAFVHENMESAWAIDTIVGSHLYSDVHAQI